MQSIQGQLFDVEFEILDLKDRLEALHSLRQSLFLKANEDNYKNFKWLAAAHPGIPNWYEALSQYLSEHFGDSVKTGYYYTDDGLAQAAFNLSFKHKKPEDQSVAISNICDFFKLHIEDLEAHSDVTDGINWYKAVLFWAHYTTSSDGANHIQFCAGYVPSMGKWFCATHNYKHEIKFTKMFDDYVSMMDCLAVS